MKLGSAHAALEKPFFPAEAAAAHASADDSSDFETQQEIELKFAVKTKRIRKHVDLRDLPCHRITQAYISPRLLPAVLMLCHPPGNDSYRRLAHNPNCFVSARVRHTMPLFPQSSGNGAASAEMELQLKGPRISRFKRREVSIRLSHEEFFRALSYATDGMMEKIRFTHSGYVIGRDNNVHAAEAHLDFIISAGPPHALELCPWGEFRDHPLAFVDIELPKLSLISRLKNDEHHPFAYLRGGINLLSEASWLRKTTGTRAIAKLGFGHKDIRSALRTLEKRLR